uniref:RNA helicase n=1 Tax=Rhabditophanes sp. KR3021 TaxID=114890 RepID=A0AC35TRW9_9BILA
MNEEEIQKTLNKYALKRKRLLEEEKKKNELEFDLEDEIEVKRPNVVAEIIKEQSPEPIPTVQETQANEEKKLLEDLAPTKGLKTVAEFAKGVIYTEPMKTNWRPPKSHRKQDPEEWEKIRKQQMILTEGEDIPPIIESFQEMKFPKQMVDAFRKKGIIMPTPIQKQGMPVALSGRDMIGIASTGAGKTITFCAPLIAFCLQQEMNLRFGKDEGPYGLIIVPSRELAQQIYDVCREICYELYHNNLPDIKSALVIGGQNMNDQKRQFGFGVHIVVATPGRLRALLNAKVFNLELCRYIVLDEADRMLDLGFEDELSNVFSHFKAQRQTLLFSATMPRKIQNFAKGALVKPIIVNIGRAGAASLNVTQDITYVRKEDKLHHILISLQKTAPRVLIFAEKKSDVDTICEFLLTKGVSAASIHGDKDQDERHEAVTLFRKGKRDVLVATDIASKGLDFDDVRHVINFDMPEDIENYVHRIGRTGRSGRKGLSTTFINRKADLTTLADLKQLLLEAGQELPEILKEMTINEPIEVISNTDDNGQGNGCAYCSGLGHRITNCPKLENIQRKQQNFGRDNEGFYGSSSQY